MGPSVAVLLTIYVPDVRTSLPSCMARLEARIPTRAHQPSPGTHLQRTAGRCPARATSTRWATSATPHRGGRCPSQFLARQGTWPPSTCALWSAVVLVARASPTLNWLAPHAVAGDAQRASAAPLAPFRVVLPAIISRRATHPPTRSKCGTSWCWRVSPRVRTQPDAARTCSVCLAHAWLNVRKTLLHTKVRSKI